MIDNFTNLHLNSNLLELTFISYLVFFTQHCCSLEVSIVFSLFVQWTHLDGCPALLCPSVLSVKWPDDNGQNSLVPREGNTMFYTFSISIKPESLTTPQSFMKAEKYFLSRTINQQLKNISWRQMSMVRFPNYKTNFPLSLSHLLLNEGLLSLVKLNNDLSCLSGFHRTWHCSKITY